MAAGLHLAPAEVEQSLRRLDVSPDDRAEDLSLDDWERLAAGWEQPG